VDNGNGRLQIFDADGTFLETWGEPGTGDGQFSFRRSNGGDGYGGIAFAPDGSFYVLDPGNHRVQKFDADRHFVTSWGSFGSQPGQFIDPIGLAVDGAGTVYVVDDERDVVEWYDSTGAVQGSFDVHPDGNGEFNTINNLAVDAAGNVYVSDIPAFQVLKFAPDGTLVARFGEQGDGDGQFREQPHSMAIDAAGRLFVTETPGGGKVHVFAADGRPVVAWGAEGQFPLGIVLDGAGNLYVDDHGANTVQKFRLLPPLVPEGTPAP
jgi:sugar lactone lactonase YvrE